MVDVIFLLQPLDFGTICLTISRMQTLLTLTVLTDHQRNSLHSRRWNKDQF